MFLIEKERLVAQQSTGRNSAGCNCMPCPGFGGGWPRNPATGPCGREEVARLGSGSEIQLLVPQFLPPWGWHVDEGWLVAFPPVGREMSPGWSWGRQHPGETPAAETTSALGPISQELQIGAVGSKGPPGRLSRRSRNVSVPHSMWNNCLNPREEILSPEQLWGYDRKPAPLLPKIKQFILLFAISYSRKPWISSKTWQRCTLGHDEERNWLRWFGWVFFLGHCRPFSIRGVVSAISVTLSLLCCCWCWWCCKSACKVLLAEAPRKAEICILSKLETEMT